MRRFMATLGVIALFVFVATAAVAGDGKKTAQKVPSGERVEMVDPQFPPQLVQAQHDLDRLARANVSCSTFSCVNRALNKQANKIAILQEDVNILWMMYTDCVAFMPVTQYGDLETYGYLWWDAATPDVSYLTTSLDITWGEDPVTGYTWVWDMEACPL